MVFIFNFILRFICEKSDKFLYYSSCEKYIFCLFFIQHIYASLNLHEYPIASTNSLGGFLKFTSVLE